MFLFQVAIAPHLSNDYNGEYSGSGVDAPMSLTAKQLADLMPDATQLESDEPEMESSLHYAQLALLVACLEWLWRDRSNFFIGANLTIYFSREQLKNKDFRGPDFFLVKDTQKRPQKSWVFGRWMANILTWSSNSCLIRRLRPIAT